MAALIAAAVVIPSASAASKAPRITRAKMKDKDRDGKADGVVLTYSERVRHRRDRDGSFPFKVEGYKVRKVAGAKRSLKLVITLKENGDAVSDPDVTYRRTNKQPVKSLSGRQAKEQTFTDTVALVVAPEEGHATLEVRFSGDGDGTVTSADGTVDCERSCSVAYPVNTPVVLTASAAEGSLFEGWSGDCSGDLGCSVTMDANKTVGAAFELQPVEEESPSPSPSPTAESVTLTVKVVGTGAGTVVSTDGQIDCPTVCEATYAGDETVVLRGEWDLTTATFDGWSGDCMGNTLCTLTMDGDKSVTATFTASGV